MKMMAFPMEVWKLHRRVHHRFLKFWDCFRFQRAAVNLPELQPGAGESDGDDTRAVSSSATSTAAAAAGSAHPTPHVINLLTSESDDSDEGPQSGEDGSNDETIPTTQVVESDEDVSNDETSTDQ